MAIWSEILLRILLASSLRALFVAGGLAAILAAFRIRSGSVRHAAWAAALCVMLLMPVLPSLMPAIEIPGRIHAIPFQTEILSQPAVQLTAAVVEILPVTPNTVSVPEARPANPIWPVVALVLYAAILVVLCTRLAVGWIAMRKLLHRSSPVSLTNSVIFESPLVASPVTLGMLWPEIILPEGWRTWPRLKRRAILTHEIAHIRRRDPLIRFLAQLHCCIFWFNPLSWWLKRTLSVFAEHACDETAVRIVGQPRRYAEMLLDVSNAVRGQGSRLSWQGLGVHGDGMMNDRIERVLQFGAIPRVSGTRKVMVFLTAGLFVILAVACREQATSTIEEEREALKQFTSEQVQQQETIRQLQLMDASDTFIKGNRLTPQEVSQLESRVATNPEGNVAGRKQLVYYYWWQLSNSNPAADIRNVISARRRHILWLIQNRPNDLFRRPSAMYIPADESLPMADPEGHELAKKLWLAQTDKTDVNLHVLRNAAFFFESEEKPLAEQLLMRARMAVANDQSTNDLGRLYGLTITGLSGFTDFPFVLGDTARPKIRIRQDPGAQEVQRKLRDSNDDRLLSAVGMHLLQLSRQLSKPELGTMGVSYLQHAVQLNPASLDAVQMLAEIRSGPHRQRLYTLPTGDDRYPAVAALPKQDRFDLLWELAHDRFVYGSSFDVSQRDFALREWEKSRKYAEDLVRLAPEFSSEPEYGAALLNGNLMLAFVATEHGETRSALKYLRDATNAPATQGMGHIAAPWEHVCRTLVEHGEKEAVMEFLDRVAEKVPVEKTRILAYAAQLRSGQTPNWQMYPL